MAEQKIELRKVRDFGEVINDTFAFLRQNLQPLFLSFFAICGIFMLAQAVTSGLYQSHLFGRMGQLRQYSPGSNSFSALSSLYSGVFNAEYFLTLLFSAMTIASIKVFFGAYFKFYLENDGRAPRIDEVWQVFKRYYFRILVYNIPAYAIFFIGLVFCFAPGIYFWIVLAPFNMIVIIEDKDFGAAFSRAFEIIKENFWNTFLVYVVAVIIYIACSLVVSIALGAAFGFGSYFAPTQLSEAMAILKSFFSIFTYSFFSVYLIAVALQYFSLSEKHDGTGILNRIDNIGNNRGPFDNIEEQY